MIRIIVLLIVIALLSLGVSFIADEPGKVVIDWSYYHIETSVLTLIAGTAFLMIDCLLFYALLHLFLHGPHNWKKSRLAKRQLLGLDSLTQTFAAIATQDIKNAHRKLKQAQKYLPGQPITLMLAAQLARIEGNEANAKLYVEQMLGHEMTELMALRSLIEKEKNANNVTQAVAHAEKALSLKPDDNWVIATLSELYARAGRTQDAYSLLERSLKKRRVNRKFFLRETAYIFYEEARRLVENKRLDYAIDMLEQCLDRLPDFAPAAVLLAEIHVMREDTKKAIKTLSSAWKTGPAKELREALLATAEKHRSDQKVLSSIGKIATMHPEHEESVLLSKGLDKIS